MKNGWIVFMKVFALIAFCLILGIGIMYPFVFMNSHGESSILIGILLLVGVPFGAFVFIAISMIFLNLAEDISDIKEILKKK